MGYAWIAPLMNTYENCEMFVHGSRILPVTKQASIEMRRGEQHQCRSVSLTCQFRYRVAVNTDFCYQAPSRREVYTSSYSSELKPRVGVCGWTKQKVRIRAQQAIQASRHLAHIFSGCPGSVTMTQHAGFGATRRVFPRPPIFWTNFPKQALL